MEALETRFLRGLALLVFALAAATASATDAAEVGSLQKVRNEIRLMLNGGEFDKVILKLTALRSSKDPATRRFAQEFLGVARQRKGQLEFARLEYQRFLNEFPNAPEASRVRMRLQALVRSTLPKHGVTVVAAETRRKKRNASRSLHGAVGLSYRGSQNTDNTGNTITSLSLLGTDVDLTGQSFGESSEMGFRISAGRYTDLQAGGRNSTRRLSDFYVDYGYRENVQFRAGRQRARTHAILGRFDGINVTYKTNKGPEFSIFGGQPVDLSRQAFFSDSRHFMGVGINTGRIWPALKLGAYALDQTIGGVVDRRAVGAEARYVGDHLFADAFLDYDVHFRKLNAIWFNVNKLGTSGTSFNFNYSFQKSPYLSTRNALIGQPVDSIQELQNLLTASDQLQLLALDRSLNSQTATAGFSHPLTTHMGLSGSVSWFSIGAGAASGGLPATPKFNEVYGEARLSIDDFILQNQNLNIGVMYSAQQSSHVWSFMSSTSYRPGAGWSFSPRMRVDMRRNLDGSTQTNYSPSLRADFRSGHNTIFSQFGYLLYYHRFPVLDSQKYSIRFVYIGYQYHF